MSFMAEENVKCPCGEEFEAPIWSSVNADQHPELREEILAGQLNVGPCPMCKRMVYAERFVLYHDPGAELMAFVYPAASAGERDAWTRRTEKDFKAAQESVAAGEKVRYPPLTLFGLDQLVDLLKEEQEFADQGDIVEMLAGRLKLDVVTLDASRARRDRVPARLPLARGKAPAPERLREGITAVLAANDRLDVYAALRKRLDGRELDPARLFGER